MIRLIAGLSVLVLLILIVASGVRFRTATPLDGRMRYLMTWIAARTDYSADVRLPYVRFLPREEINRRYASDSGRRFPGRGEVEAVYQPDVELITLPSSYDAHWDEDTLVHELVHHLQNLHGRQYRCPEDREREAYLIQRRYVLETGFGTPPSLGFITSLRCSFQ